jgi:hypothetical protein
MVHFTGVIASQLNMAAQLYVSMVMKNKQLRMEVVTTRTE